VLTRDVVCYRWLTSDSDWLITRKQSPYSTTVQININSDTKSDKAQTSRHYQHSRCKGPSYSQTTKYSVREITQTANCKDWAKRYWIHFSATITQNIQNETDRNKQKQLQHLQSGCWSTTHTYWMTYVSHGGGLSSVMQRAKDFCRAFSDSCTTISRSSWGNAPKYVENL